MFIGISIWFQSTKIKELCEVLLDMIFQKKISFIQKPCILGCLKGPLLYLLEKMIILPPNIGIQNFALSKYFRKKN
jgi:hypothetical protein